jgi:virginiamycin B lyase
VRRARRRSGIVAAIAAGLALIAPMVVLASVAAPVEAIEPWPAPGGYALWHEVPTSSGDEPVLLLTDDMNRAWYAEWTTNRIVRYDPAIGTEVSFTLGATPRYPLGAVLTSDGNLWFADSGSSSIGRLDPATGHADFFPLAGPSHTAYGLSVGADGRVWFSDPLEETLGNIDAAGTIRYMPVPLPGIVLSMKAGSDGALWFVVDGTSLVGRFDPIIRTWETVDTGHGGLTELTVARDGAFWVGANDALVHVGLDFSVAELPLDPGTGATVRPHHPVAGEYAELYFIDADRGIGRLDLAGTVTYQLPFAGTSPTRLAVSPNGTVWYSDQYRHSLIWS